MTKEEALRDLKAIAEGISIASDNHESQGWKVSRFVWQNWKQRLEKIIATLES